MSELATPVSGIVGLDGKPISDKPHWFDDEQGVKDFIAENLGDLEDIDVFYGWVLVAKYIREEVAKGIKAAPETQREDSWQGSVGLVLKKGPGAFVSDGNNNFYGADVKVGDWVLYRNSDGWDKNIAMIGVRTSFVQCRFIQDAHINGRVKYPGRLF